MEEDRPLITKKLVLIVLSLFFLAFGLASFFLLYKGPGQNLDEEEIQLDFATEDSKIAGIQKLITDGGLSQQQYDIVYKKLNDTLPDLEPESRYFTLVEESLAITSSGKDDNSIDWSSLPSSEVQDDTADEPIPEEESVRREVSDGDDAALDMLVFTMRSEFGNEYSVKVVTSADFNSAEVTIEKQ